MMLRTRSDRVWFNLFLRLVIWCEKVDWRPKWIAQRLLPKHVKLWRWKADRISLLRIAPCMIACGATVEDLGEVVRNG